MQTELIIKVVVDSYTLTNEQVIESVKDLMYFKDRSVIKSMKITDVSIAPKENKS